MANEHDTTPSAPTTQPQSTGSAAASGYLAHVTNVLARPDAFFERSTRSPKAYGLITIGAFLLLVLLQSLMTRITRFSGWSFEAAYLGQAVKLTLAIGIPIAALLFVLKWQAGRSNGPASLDFYIEKFGAALILPCLLLLLALPLIVLKVAIQGWFPGAAFVLVYVAVFLMSYWYAAPERLKAAVVFMLGFYLAYRLLLLLF